MNKQELIKKYEMKGEQLKEFPIVAIGDVLKNLRKLDEPEKVKIPQFVADWIEYCKVRKITLAHALYHSEEAKNKSVYRWLFEDEDTQTTAIGFYLSFLNVTPATYAPFEKCYWDNCEVIGNIHENELDLIMYESWKFNKELEDETL